MESELIVIIFTAFASLVGFIGQAIVRRLASIDKDIKELLVNHGQRIAKLETRASFVDQRAEKREY